MSVAGDAREAQMLTVGNEAGQDQAADDAAQAADTDGFGAALRGAREKAGLSVGEIANTLKVTERTVHALEAELYEELPPRPYVRGYVRRYARLVGLDATTVTVGSDSVETEPVLPAVVPRSRRAVFNDFARESWGLVYGSIVLVFVALIGGALWWAWPGGNAEPAAPEAASNAAVANQVPRAAASPPTPEVVTEAFSTVSGEPDEGLGSTAAVPESPPPIALDSFPPDIAPLEPEVVDAGTDEAATEGDGLAEPDLITFVFRGECWVEVRDRDDDLLHGDLGRDGETLTLPGRAPFSVLVGNPAVVDVTFNGERVSVDSGLPGQVARFEVGG